VSEQNLLNDAESGAVHHPGIDILFGDLQDGVYRPCATLN
jgi:heat shock protein HspQ